MTVVLSSVVLVAFGATTASARPLPVNPPAPTGTITVNPSGTVTVNVSGTWSWPVGTGANQLNATAGNACGTNYGVGWAMVWNDPNDSGYKISYKKGGHSFSTNVGSKGDPSISTVADESVNYNTSTPCGTFTTSAVSGQWTASHTYANAGAVPAGGLPGQNICVVTYVLHAAPAGHKKMYLADKNRHNSYRMAVKSGNGASWPTSSACFDPAALKSSPIIVTTATNAQVGSPITDTAALSGTSSDVKSVQVNAQAITVGSPAGGTVVFNLFGPTDTNCTSTPIFTSTPITVNGNGTYGPVSFTPTQGAGTYRWIATYSGDPNNNGATETCGAPGETSVVSTTPVTTPTNPPTSPAASVPVVVTAAKTGTVLTPVAGATTVHTGEPWAGSKPFEVALIAFGLSLMGLGFVQRRRLALRKHAGHGAVTAD
ncbi:MAG TPA: hypothetical protein VID75_11765 [Acidimicrobiales bacterium]|jgi:hypothetical protein